MGYFLGKDTFAVPSASVPAVNAQSLTPTNVLGGEPDPKNPPVQPPPGGSTGGWTGAKCIQDCKGRGYVYDTPAFDACFEECMARGTPECDATHPCPGGKQCIDGKCQGNTNTCDAAHPCKPPKICKNYQCIDPATLCDATHPCPAGKKCVEGECVEDTGPSTCPDGKGVAYAKNPTACPCGTGWSTLSGKCGAGYTFIKRDDPSNWKSEFPYIAGAIGTCQCTQAIADWKAKKGSEGGDLGEYQYPAGMQELMTMLLDRGKSVYGYDPKAIEAMFGRGFENVRGQEAGMGERLTRTLGSQGMLGTGTAVEQRNDLGFGTEKNINDLARDIMIKNEEQKRADTELSSSILGRGMGFEQLLEAINSGRRGESQNALAMLLSLLQLFQG